MAKQKTDIVNPTGTALGFTKPGQKWTIVDGVTVASGDAFGVFSEFDKSTLVNKGHVYGDNIGVFFLGQKKDTVINKEGGSITGGFGVAVGDIGSKNITVKNDGSVLGLAQSGVAASDVANFELHNTGSIYGLTAGVRATVDTFGANKGSMIDNAGLIHSDLVGIFGLTVGLTTEILNRKGGTIKGGDYSVLTTAGKLSLANEGVLKGGVRASGFEARDKVVNQGKIKGVVELGTGDDVFKNEGGKTGKVFSGDGDDRLVAGNSKDKFVFSGPLNASTNVDRVKGFESGKDKFFLDRTTFTALADGKLPNAAFEKGKQADDLADRIIHRKNKGELYYDEDGSATGFAQVQIARLDPGQTLKAGDFTAMFFA